MMLLSVRTRTSAPRVLLSIPPPSPPASPPAPPVDTEWYDFELQKRRLASTAATAIATGADGFFTDNVREMVEMLDGEPAS